MRHPTLHTALPLPASHGRATRRNGIVGEAHSIRLGVAPISQALTFAQAKDADHQVVTLLVTGWDGDSVEGIDLAGLGAPPCTDVFDALAAVGEERLRAAARSETPRARRRLADLLPSGAATNRHVATGTNFAEHAREAGIDSVFQFPKFGLPTAPTSRLVVETGTLMDYEVEISVRFDRDIRTPADFASARKGFFLCGDFTDRATLLRLIDPRHVASGRGFSDAKSGPGWFPTGPFLVVPDDWRDFVRSERIVTRLNGDVRQDARGRSMILDFEALVAKALADQGRHYIHRGEAVSLLEDGNISRGTAVMSGTSEGVIFMPPMREDFIGGIIDHVALGRFLRGTPLMASIANRFTKGELKAGRYLRPGDTVEHLSSSLGSLSVVLEAA